MTSLDTSTRPIRVGVVAADARVRTSLRHLLTSGGGTVVVESYGAGPRPATTAPVVGTDTDVVVLDLDPATPENHLEQLRGLPAGLPTVVLGNDRHTADVARAAGASYLDKAEVADLLLDLVHERSGGDAFVGLFATAEVQPVYARLGFDGTSPMAGMWQMLRRRPLNRAFCPCRLGHGRRTSRPPW